MKLLKRSVQLVCLSIVANTYAADGLRYTLLPGSEITRLLLGTPISRTEPLTGTFDWIRFDTSITNVVGFNATHLDFQSESFRIRLNATVNDLGTSVFRDSCLTLFGEIVDLTGLDTTLGNLSSAGNGCYSGPPDRPNSLSYPDVRISPVGGGLFEARLSIIAALDDDRDGVPDESDLCPNTAAGAIVDAEGCSIDQLVPCAGPLTGGAWENHGRYVSSVVHVAERFVNRGVITRDQGKEIAATAARSDCGRKSAPRPTRSLRRFGTAEESRTRAFGSKGLAAVQAEPMGAGANAWQESSKTAKDLQDGKEVGRIGFYAPDIWE